MDLTRECSADERLQFSAGGHDLVVADHRNSASDVVPRLARTRIERLTVLAGIGETLDSEREHGNFFLFVPVLIAGGALLYFSALTEPDFVRLLLVAGALAAFAAVTATRPLLRPFLLAALCLTVGVIAAKVETWRAATPMLGSEISTRLTGRVVRIEHQESGRVRLTLDVLATRQPELRYAPDRVRVTARSVPETLRPGETVDGVVRLMPPSGPVRPDSYDFAFRSYFDGIGAVGFFLTAPERAARADPPDLADAIAARVEDWRTRMADRIASRIGGPEGGIAAALITGLRAGIPEEINEALRIVGLYHVISISGLHMALVGGTVMVAMRTGFALAPAFSMRRPVKKYSAAAALAATAFYLLMSGADIAAQRSFIMLAVMLIAVIFDRAALTMRNLAISAIIILLVAPHEVVGPSFQMSFAATAALVAAYAAWTGWREGRPRAAPPSRGPAVAAFSTGLKYIGGLSMTSIVAGGATALFTAWHFQQVAPLGLVANLAAMPFVSIIVMPMAVLASVLMPFGLDGPALIVMGYGIAAMNDIALWLAAYSAYDATGAIPLDSVLILTAALALLTMTGGMIRWAAVPLVGLGTALVVTHQLPDVLVSEDARLVAVRQTASRVAVNRARPRAFTMQNWQRALATGTIIRPQKVEGDIVDAVETDDGFVCGDGLCVVRHQSGAVVVHAEENANAAAACAYASVIVIDDATAGDPCGGTVAVITKRDLAQRGSAEITFSKAIKPHEAATEFTSSNATRIEANVRFAITEPHRRWHEHRQFSREARGLAPYRARQSDGE